MGTVDYEISWKLLNGKSKNPNFVLELENVQEGVRRGVWWHYLLSKFLGWQITEYQLFILSRSL